MGKDKDFLEEYTLYRHFMGNFILSPSDLTQSFSNCVLFQILRQILAGARGVAPGDGGPGDVPPHQQPRRLLRLQGEVGDHFISQWSSAIGPDHSKYCPLIGGHLMCQSLCHNNTKRIKYVPGAAFLLACLYGTSDLKCSTLHFIVKTPDC